ncbi:hypothetical protein DPMN_035623 [Dreissena polymorpha]|uniref:Uncharacterized protein n=1 Tax=Dreissena polymorpha TaxID=45954 RepID=A0A9D4M7M5_DREPO|nr:hypothetical protein DPMN_035623 [Dreissena polymorpha]
MKKIFSISFLYCLLHKVLRDFMLECLRKADRHSKKSIVFTSMGTGGYLGYPRETVASLMYGTVVEFDSSYTATSLQEVNILLYSKDTDTVKVGTGSKTKDIPLIALEKVCGGSCTEGFP